MFFSDLCRLTFIQKQHMREIIYFNHDDTFVDVTNPSRDELVKYQKIYSCRAIKEALGYLMITVLSTNYKHY